MDGLQRALQPEGLAQLLQCQIGLPAQQGAHRALMVRHDLGLAPGQVMAGSDVPGVPALCKQLLDHAKRHPEASRDILTRSLPGIIGAQDSFP